MVDITELAKFIQNYSFGVKIERKSVRKVRLRKDQPALFSNKIRSTNRGVTERV